MTSSEQRTSERNIDLQKLLKQQLHSLNQFGLQEISRGNGDLKLQFAEAAPERSAAETPIPKPPSPNSADVSKPAPEAASPPVAKPAAIPKVAPVLPAIQGEFGAAVPADQRAAALQVIEAQVQNCTVCDELCASRSRTVFGVGNPSARLVFVGEGPGADEDRLGEPFVGAAGKLLNKILSASQLKREEVYILNTVKCRPPLNRTPTEAEIRNCWDYADRQLELIQPEFICCLGSVAAKTMLQTTEALGRLRGRFHPWKGSRLIVTYHPAYLLRNESAKRHVWEDMQMLVKEMGIELSN